MKVQYGCGMTAPEGWLNFDASPTLRYERIPVLGRWYRKNSTRFPDNARYGDIVRGLPVADAQCDLVYCSHVLEHLCLDDCRTALRNTLRILKPGGVFRLVVPDLEHSIRLYLDSTAPAPAIEFQRETLLGVESRPRGLMGFATAWFGNSRHLWMWDYRSLAHELAQAGFVDIRRAQFADSAHQEFREVEEHHRWAGALGVECLRR